MAERRSVDPETSKWTRKLLSGPGKICQAMAIDKEQDGLDADSNDLWIGPGEKLQYETDTRIGLNRKTCGDCVDFPWRYCAKGSAFLSRAVAKKQPQKN